MLAEDWDGQLRGVKDRLHVDVETKVVVGFGDLEERSVAVAVARIVDQDVEAAELVDRSVDHARHLVALRNVRFDRYGVATDLLQHGLGRGAVDIDDHDLSAFDREAPGYASSEAGATARDNRDFIGQPHRFRLCLVLLRVE